MRTKHQLCKHKVDISLPSCSPALCQVRTWSTCQVQQLDPRCCGGDRSLWAQQSLILCCLASWSLHSHSFFVFVWPGISQEQPFMQAGSWLSSSLGCYSWSSWMIESCWRLWSSKSCFLLLWTQNLLSTFSSCDLPQNLGWCILTHNILKVPKWIRVVLSRVYTSAKAHQSQGFTNPWLCLLVQVMAWSNPPNRRTTGDVSLDRGNGDFILLRRSSRRRP